MIEAARAAAFLTGSRAGSLWFAPLVGLASGGVPNALNVRRDPRVEFASSLDRFGLSTRNRARAARIRPANREVALGALFYVDPFVSHKTTSLLNAARDCATFGGEHTPPE